MSRLQHKEDERKVEYSAVFWVTRNRKIGIFKEHFLNKGGGPVF